MKKYRIWSDLRKEYFYKPARKGKEDASPDWVKFWWDNNKDRELNGKKISETHRLEEIDENEEWDQDEV